MIRIMVVEGADHAGELLRESPDSAFEVVTARDSRSALRKLRREFYDVVVVELPNPAAQAEELFRSILSLDEEQAMRIVFVAADLSDSGTRRFLTEAGRPFLTRPVDADELHEMIVRVASSAGTRGEEPPDLN